MDLKLKCIQDCTLQSPSGDSNIKIKNGDELNAVIFDGEGIRFKIENTYTFPFYISDVEKVFTAIPHIIHAEKAWIYPYPKENNEK